MQPSFFPVAFGPVVALTWSERASPPPPAAQFPYSQIAAAATYVAQLAVGTTDPYSDTLQRHSGYTLNAMMDCAQHLASLMRKAPNSSLVAVYKKVGGVQQGESGSEAACS